MDKVEKRASELLEEHGVQEVIEFGSWLGVPNRFCIECETETPEWEGNCLVCGTEFKEGLTTHNLDVAFSEYVKSDCMTCPECGIRGELVGGQWIAGVTKVQRKVHCDECETDFTEIFEIIGIQ